jgi:hypothetical protein
VRYELSLYAQNRFIFILTGRHTRIVLLPLLILAVFVHDYPDPTIFNPNVLPFVKQHKFGVCDYHVQKTSEVLGGKSVATLRFKYGSTSNPVTIANLIPSST